MAKKPKPPIEPMGFDEAVKFLESVNAAATCPVCGSSNGWGLRARLESAGTQAHYPGLVGATDGGDAYLSFALPVITVSCKNCGYMRLHDLLAISRRNEPNDGEPDND